MPKVFSYGTLQDPKVQRTLFGKTLQGKPDAVNGYQRVHLEYDGGNYPALIKGDRRYIGQTYEISFKELMAMDEYEGDAYVRDAITTEEGNEAYLYILNPNIKINGRDNKA